MYINSEFERTCSKNRISQQKADNKSLCGNVHLHNFDRMHSTKSLLYVYNIKVPHMFYIQLQFLEIVLVGGLRQRECALYQNVKVLYYTIFPFSSSQHNRVLAFFFCGSHPPFTTILPGNAVYLEGIFNINNSFASCELKYSAVDQLVSVFFLSLILIYILYISSELVAYFYPETAQRWVLNCNIRTHKCWISLSEETTNPMKLGNQIQRPTQTG